jgi:hypothetical protein
MTRLYRHCCEPIRLTEVSSLAHVRRQTQKTQMHTPPCGSHPPFHPPGIGPSPHPPFHPGPGPPQPGPPHPGPPPPSPSPRHPCSDGAGPQAAAGPTLGPGAALATPAPTPAAPPARPPAIARPAMIFVTFIVFQLPLPVERQTTCRRKSAARRRTRQYAMRAALRVDRLRAYTII